MTRARGRSADMARRVTATSTLRPRRSRSGLPATPQAKIVPPDPPRAYVARPALDNRLDEVFGRRMTVVVAGPGFGKSTLVAAWARRNGAAWYSTDSADSSLILFARGLESALAARGGGGCSGGGGARFQGHELGTRSPRTRLGRRPPAIPAPQPLAYSSAVRDSNSNPTTGSSPTTQASWPGSMT